MLLRKLSKNLILLSCLFATTLSFAGSKPLITRHIYVHLFSGKWIIQYSGDTTIDGCGQGPCVMQDGMVINYGSDEGNVTITDPQNKSKTFEFAGAGTFGKDGYIYHDGSTGNVYLNDPANGDIVVNGSTWGY